MKIAMLGSRGLPATHGGVERAVEELSLELVQRGHAVTVFCRPGYCDPRQPTRYRGTELRYLPALPSKHLETASHMILAAIAAARGRFDVVHIHSIGPALFSWIPRVWGSRVVVTVHALDWGRSKWGGIARTTLRLGACAAAILPNATIAVSQRSCRFLQESYGRKAVYLPNGVRLPSNAMGQVGTPDHAVDEPYALFLGRLVPEKRVEDLIGAFREVVTGPARLTIAGDGYFSDDYVASLKQLAAPDPRIRFVGGVYGEQKTILIERARVLVNPSELEGHPIVVLEALAHGVPVLVSDIEEHREILEADGGSAILGTTFDVRDQRHLGERLCAMLMANGAAVEREGRRQFVQRHFDWGVIAERTERVYALTAARFSGEEGAGARREGVC